MRLATDVEDFGYCSKTGRCFNPFGIKPRWVMKRAAFLRQMAVVESTEAAPY